MTANRPARMAVTVVSEASLLAGFALAYALAAVAGRLTVLPDSGISMVWPAAGVSVLWMVARARRPWIAVDLALMGVLTWAVVSATGGTPLQSVFGGLAAVVQAVVCRAVLARHCPRVWFSRAGRLLDRRELWWFLLAAVAGPLISSPLIQVDGLLSGTGWQWNVVLLWCARNLGSIVVLVPVGFMVGDSVRRRRAGLPILRLSDLGAGLASRPLEWFAVLVLSPAVHAAWFAGFAEPTVVFPLLTLACWAGVRLPARFVIGHGALVAVVAIALTAGGIGPFLGLDDATTQIAVAQLYTVLVCTIGLALALDRDDRHALATALREARDGAQTQAELLRTIVDTMTEGVRVVDRDGRIVVRNPAARRLLTGDDAEPAEGTAAADDLAGLRHLDGSPLPDHELPFRRSLAGEDVKDLPLLVRPPVADERTVAFTTARLPARAGGGVVTVLRDVTLERAELERAAQVQAALLPVAQPRLPGYSLAARFVPAGSVGGDFYDWHEVEDGAVITLADVMGKGMGAAILAATARSLLRAHSADGEVVRPLVETERRMDADLANAGAFVTAFRAFVRASTGEIAYADAGHGLAAIVPPEGDVRRLPAGGLPLGIAPEEQREAGAERLAPGETLLVVSDGVLDAVGGGLDDLAPVWRRVSSARSAPEAVEAVVELASHGTPDDDLTVIALRRR